MARPDRCAPRSSALRPSESPRFRAVSIAALNDLGSGDRSPPGGRPRRRRSRRGKSPARTTRTTSLSRSLRWPPGVLWAGRTPWSTQRLTVVMPTPRASATRAVLTYGFPAFGPCSFISVAASPRSSSACSRAASVVGRPRGRLLLIYRFGRYRPREIRKNPQNHPLRRPVDAYYKLVDSDVFRGTLEGPAPEHRRQGSTRNKTSHRRRVGGAGAGLGPRCPREVGTVRGFGPRPRVVTCGIRDGWGRVAPGHQVFNREGQIHEFGQFSMGGGLGGGAGERPRRPGGSGGQGHRRDGPGRRQLQDAADRRDEGGPGGHAPGGRPVHRVRPHG